MKVKIINDNLCDFGRIFNVRRMNFNEIIVNCEGQEIDRKKFSHEDVECIVEQDIDDFLINNREFLKIKLKRGISVTLYKALYEAIKMQISADITKINVLKDKYSLNKRGIWEKQMVILVNSSIALNINASGKNFKKSDYHIDINQMDIKEIVGICKNEVDNLNKIIELKKAILNEFNEVLQITQDLD